MTDRTTRFVLCSTPAQGHTAPLLALAGRLVHDGHEVVFFTTEHYRGGVMATGAGFMPFDPSYDVQDLMVANPDRESSARRGVRGVKDDLRQIFIGPIPGQYRDLRASRRASRRTASSSTRCSSAPSPTHSGSGRHGPPSPASASCPMWRAAGTAQRDRAAAGFGAGVPCAQPSPELGDRARHDEGHSALRRPAVGRGRIGGFRGYVIDLQPRVVDAFLQACAAGFEYPRSDLAPAVRFVGPILPPPSGSFVPPAWWDELRGRARPVVHVTQGRLDNADLGRLLLLTADALRHDEVLVVATPGGPEPGPRRRGLPDNARLKRFIPHDELLPYVDALVTNGGYGAVQQALAHGAPLVVAGNSEDKPGVAARVRWSDAGINLRTGKPSKATVARAVRRVLTTPPTAAGPGPCEQR